MFREQTADAAQQVTDTVKAVVQSKAAIYAAATGGEQAVRDLADGMTTEEIGRVIDQLKR
ncbi:hypothetical protein C0Q57_19225 [Streptomyces albidoflavus]|uniref:hypothetical protein n=1 Tax=Streptomyces albidoflavus TaxID=1886 RepID=UPI001020BA54|nr:hypothetical protein [Streptomyces albidoflavus]RZD64998.1 hypothetical protein C0Q57_19225 [Streptomyces albidoflavus]